ncbi:hypothetical protein OROGR_025043 [Orobanche gracilis]
MADEGIPLHQKVTMEATRTVINILIHLKILTVTGMIEVERIHKKHKNKNSRKRHPYSDDDSSASGYHVNHKSRDEHSYSSVDDSKHKNFNVRRSSHKQSSKAHCYSQEHCRNFSLDRWHGDQKSRGRHSYSSEDSDFEKDDILLHLKVLNILSTM